MKEDDYNIYTELQSKIKNGVKEMDRIYSKLYG